MDKFLVRGSSIKETLAVTFFLGIVLTALATWVGLALDFDVPVYCIYAVGGGFLLAGIVTLLLARRLRRWAQVQEKGILLSGGGEDRFLADDQVVAMAVTRETYSPQGRFEGTLRRCYLWLHGYGDFREQVRLETRLQRNQADPLQAFMIRLETRLLAEAQANLRAGEPLQEADWRIERGELSLRDGKEWRSCPLPQVCAADFYSESVCVWIAGTDEIWAKIPEKSANSYILYKILCAEIAKHPQASPPTVKGGMGRVLFERNPGQPAVVFMVSGVLLFMGGLFLFLGILQPILWILAGIFLAPGSAFLWLALRMRKVRVRCHERGICYEGVRSTRSLRFDQVASYAYSVSLLYMRGAYAGSIFRLAFEPFPDLGLARIRFAIFDKKPDGNIEWLDDKITAIVADRLALELNKQGAAQWTGRLRLTEAGIECKPGGFLSRRPVVLRYSDIEKQDFRGATYRIWGRGNSKPIITERCNRANFYPGLRVLKQILSSRSAVSPDS